jgi:hypothetical protein
MPCLAAEQPRFGAYEERNGGLAGTGDSGDMG